MTAKKKPKLYTNTGKVKKPVARKAAPAKKLTAEYAEAMLSARLPDKSSAMESSLAQWKKQADAFEARMLEAWAEVSHMKANTIKLWFGWSLVRPAKKE